MRWTPKRKMETLVAVDAGKISPLELECVWGISDEEINGWRKLYMAHGKPGLRATQLQAYQGRRPTSPNRPPSRPRRA